MKLRTLLAATATLALLVPLAGAEPIRKGNVQVDFDANIAPKALPRTGSAPVSIAIEGKIGTTDGSPPPQLSQVKIEINGHGKLDTKGLAVCRLDQIQPATTRGALEACGDARVGAGSFSADVVIPEQSPFPSDGEVVAFNGVQGGKPVIFAHVYGVEPIPTSFTLPLKVSHAKGRFGAVLTATLPNVTSSVASVTGISLNLHRTYSFKGERRSYLSAGCPAPKGFPGTLYALARASFEFAAGPRLVSTLTRECRVRG